MDTAKKYLGGWNFSIKAEMISVCRPVDVSVYRAEEKGRAKDLLSLVPSFDTTEGVFVPVSSVVPGPVDHTTYILQWIRVGSSEIFVFYDRGPSINLIQGSIVEKEGINCG